MKRSPVAATYGRLLSDLSGLLEQARRTSVRVTNAVMTAAYWETGRRIVEYEQGGKDRAAYGEQLLDRLAADLTVRLGRGFSRPNLIRFRQFYLAFPPGRIRSTLSNISRAPALPAVSTALLSAAGRSIRSTASNESKASIPFTLSELAQAFPLPWSAYVLLVSRSRSPEALEFYHTEALRGGWSVRQLDRQMESLFYERAALSKDKATVLKKGTKPRPGDVVSADEEIRDPLVLVIIDLKLAKFTHADAGQMHLYLNYAREHWTNAGENPPVGLILCTSTDAALAKYTLENLPNKVLAREYRLALPEEKLLVRELEKTRKQLEARR